MGGNIGEPILSLDPLPGGGVYVLELSSYQIDLTQSLDCDVAVLLNITPDHLDRYESFEAYAASKVHLLEMQSGKHLNFVGDNLPDGLAIDFGTNSIAPVEASRQQRWPALAGPHNAQNAGAAIAVCDRTRLMPDEIEEGLRTFPGLPHRMERVREKGRRHLRQRQQGDQPDRDRPGACGVRQHPLDLRRAGQERHLDECAPHFGNVRSAYTIGEAGELFERLLVRTCR
jgi:UDP-N-acetylmuramoylalanine--D-glutamate ligase